MKNYGTLLMCCISSLLYAQQPNQEKDSVIMLELVVVSALKISPERKPDTKENIIYSGKKNEVLNLANFNANLTTNNAREVFSRVPGVSIWENDGSGIQINVGFRGLSPNRSWELNTRQNGYDISADVWLSRSLLQSPSGSS